jgi:hypothetical protein
VSKQVLSTSNGETAAERALREGAIAACQAELTGTSRAAAPREWAMTQPLLGDAVREVQAAAGGWDNRKWALATARTSCRAAR